MKRISSAIAVVFALIATLSFTNAMPKELLSAKQSPIFSKSGESPRVQMMEYSLNPVDSNGWGAGFSFGVDIAGKYDIPVSYLYTTKDNILVNPKVVLEVSSHNYLKLVTPAL